MRRTALSLWLCVAGAAAAPAEAPQERPAAETERLAAETDRLAAEKSARDSDLRALDGATRLGRDAEARLESELAAIAADRGRIAAELIATAGRTRDAEERVGALADELARLRAREAAVTASLDGRRAVLAEILAALQRMARRDGPAILIRAEDILAAIRSGMLLGAVLPGLKGDVEAVAADLAELVRLRERGAAEAAALGRERDDLAVATRRLALLGAYRRQQQAGLEADLDAARARAARLGAESRSLRELADRLEGDMLRTRREAEAARERDAAEAARLRERFAAAGSGEPSRLAPARAFADSRGVLPRPAAGPTTREFGTPDAAGTARRGIVIGTRPGALVTAPADGWVAYAGPFRTYGRLLIINAGGGYYLLLAGFGRIGVEAGQFVLAGEPLGRMGEGALGAAASGDVEAGETGLYVEFRKDGGPIDPSPWWMKSSGEKARG